MSFLFLFLVLWLEAVNFDDYGMRKVFRDYVDDKNLAYSEKLTK